MSFARACARMAAAATLVGVVGSGLPALAEAELASMWQELPNARARLLVGPPAGKVPQSYLAGIEIVLADGWKTYWRMPGDAGVPPNFDWSGSGNVASLKVLYPAPARMHESGSETIGYKHTVLFPVEVVPKDASRPVDLALTMEFGVCREICIPAEAKLSLTVQPASASGLVPSPLAAALEKVPREATRRRPMDPRLISVIATLDGASPRLSIEASFPRGKTSADLFVEAPDGLYLPMAKRLPDDTRSGPAPLTADANDMLVRFEVDLSRTGNAKALEGKTLLFTLVSEAGATETSWTLP